MRLGVFDILRRGFDNAIVNWQVALIRFLEAFLFMIIIAVAAIAMVAPMLISAGLSMADIDAPEDIESALAVLMSKWVMLVWILVGALVLLTVLLLVHAFIEAGCARVLVDGDRAAGPYPSGPRARYAAFSMSNFFAGGREGWWTLFWVYNIIWGVGFLIIMLPMMAIIAIAVLVGVGAGEAGAGLAVIVSCFGIVATALFSIAVMAVMVIWTNRAIVDWAVYRTTAMGAIRHAGQAIRADLGRHVAVAVCIFVLAMAASAFFASFSFLTGIGDSIGGAMGEKGANAFLLLTAPIRIFMSLVNSAISAFIGSWFLGSYSSLANNR